MLLGAQGTALKGPDFTGCGKTHSARGFEKGTDLSVPPVEQNEYRL
jgi:hypothetical protein